MCVEVAEQFLLDMEGKPRCVKLLSIINFVSQPAERRQSDSIELAHPLFPIKGPPNLVPHYLSVGYQAEPVT